MKKRVFYRVYTTVFFFAFLLSATKLAAHGLHDIRLWVPLAIAGIVDGALWVVALLKTEEKYAERSFWASMLLIIMCVAFFLH